VARRAPPRRRRLGLVRGHHLHHQRSGGAPATASTWLGRAHSNDRGWW
jgi:hypothetical protein